MKKITIDYLINRLHKLGDKLEASVLEILKQNDKGELSKKIETTKTKICFILILLEQLEMLSGAKNEEKFNIEAFKKEFYEYLENNKDGKDKA